MVFLILLTGHITFSFSLGDPRLRISTFLLRQVQIMKSTDILVGSYATYRKALVLILTVLIYSFVLLAGAWNFFQANQSCDVLRGKMQILGCGCFPEVLNDQQRTPYVHLSARVERKKLAAIPNDVYSPKTSTQLTHYRRHPIETDKTRLSRVSPQKVNDFKHFSPGGQQITCNENDLAALQAFVVNATTGYPQQGSSDCCSWTGVTCNFEGRIVVIALTPLKAMLTGSLPSQLVHLPFLRELQLPGQQGISGTLPPEWGSFSQLEILDMSQTSIEGTLPTQWSNMSSLRELVLSQTSIDGTLPPEWCQMLQLRVLDLHQSSVGGTLPPQWSAFPQLEMFDVSQTSVEGILPPQWSNMSVMRLLDLHQTNIDGTLPLEWGNMSVLHILYLHQTSISGTLPPEWSAVPLQVLYLHQTSISGTLPPEWSRMPQLEQLDLSSATISGTLPPEWSSLPLINVVITGTKIEGSLPSAWAAMRFLKYLCLSQNLLSGNIPDEWSHGMPALRTFIAVSNKLSGQLPTILPPLLSALDVSDNHFTGSIPCYFNTSLQYLYVDGNFGLVEVCSEETSSLSGLGLSQTGVTSLPMNFSSVYSSLTYLSAGGLNMTTIPPIADVPFMIFEAVGNIFDLSHLNQSLTLPKVLDLTPQVGGAFIANFSSVCHGNCTMTGPFTAVSNGCSSYKPVLGCEHDQFLSVSFPRQEFEAGNFASPISVTVLSFSSSSGYLDLTCPVVASAFIVPSLETVSHHVPSYAQAGQSPIWNSVPIALTPRRNYPFSGMQSAVLLFGVQYRLTIALHLDGTGDDNFNVCDSLPPFVYSYFTDDVALASCGANLLGLNYTQECHACPEYASCSGTQVFALSGAAVWRPTANALPFARCPAGSQGCASATDVSRVGMECAAGYEGPLCGVCSDGFGLAGVGVCSECYSQTINILVAVFSFALAIGFVTYVSIASVKKGNSANDSLSTRRRRVFSRGVKMFTNHMSLLGVLARCEIVGFMAQSLRSVLSAQQAATSPSPTSHSFFACLFPSWTPNEQLALVVALLPILVVGEMVVVRLRQKQWAVVSVTAAVLQLAYLQVIDVGSLLLRGRQLVFYDSTPYLLNGTAGLEPLSNATFDILVADPRVDFASNGGFYAFAWLTVIVCGIGTPLWFVLSYRHISHSDSVGAARERLTFLVSDFKHKRWYWESVVTVRKGASVVIVAALASYPIMQLQMLVLLYSLYYVLHEYFEPFASSRRKVAERTSYASAIVTCNVILAAYSVQLAAPAAGDASSLSSVLVVVLTSAIQLAALLMLARVIVIELKEGVQSSPIPSESISAAADDLGESLAPGGAEEMENVKPDDVYA